MRRRTLLLAAAAATLATAACGQAEPTTSTPSRQPVATGAGPVASWQLTGGYSAAGVLALRPPRLVVYPDGQTVADAAYRTDLTADEVTDLVGDLADQLREPSATRRPSNPPSIVDAPTTVLTVRTPDASYSASADGLDELREERGYSDQLYAARDRFDAMHKRIVGAGQPYTAERVRVVAEEVPPDAQSGGTANPRASAGQVRPWPAEVPVPDKEVAPGTRVADLDGERARVAVRALDRDLDLNGAWSAYRTGDGRTLRASWRYLLPNE